VDLRWEEPAAVVVVAVDVVADDNAVLIEKTKEWSVSEDIGHWNIQLARQIKIASHRWILLPMLRLLLHLLLLLSAIASTRMRRLREKGGCVHGPIYLAN